MDHRVNVAAGLMNRAVDDISRPVNAVVSPFRLPHDIAVQVNLGQAGRGDLLVRQAVEVDQELVDAGHPYGDVVVDQVGHVVQVDEPIAGGQIDARLPFL